MVTENSILNLFQSIIAPKKAQELTTLLNFFPQWWENNQFQKPQLVLGLVLKGGFLKDHKEKLLEQFLLVGNVMAQYQKDKNSERLEPFPGGEKLMKIIKVLKDQDYSKEIKNNKGKEISIAIEKKQLEKVSEMLALKWKG